MANAVAMVVGWRVRSLRMTAGLSQEAVARSVGMDRAFPGRVERCGQNVSVVTAGRIACALGVSLATLLDGVPTVGAEDATADYVKRLLERLPSLHPVGRVDLAGIATRTR